MPQIPAPLATALADRGYATLTPVQEAVTDADLAASDLLVSAQTGSGKTVGFGIAIAPTLLEGAERLDRAAAPLALVIAPTRELALQVMRELQWLYAPAGAVVTACVGGMDMRDERRALERGAHIVVATPGRLRDHITRGSIEMSDLRAVVLDEADEMLDLGFSEDLEFILAAAPATRRTLMFSATVPPGIARLAEKYQRDAVRLETATRGGQHADIEYRVMQVAPHDAENAIINILRFYEAPGAIVFANTRAAVARLTARLTNRGFSVVSLSGELSQTERTHALQSMRDGRARICVATDVAARGIDLPNLDLVIHAELPSNAEGLLHRSGRTGRAGRSGISAIVVPMKAERKAERLLKDARITAEWTVPPSADEVVARDEERLLADPVWSEPASAGERAFAAKLVAAHDADAIAAAYLRLWRLRHSAPEDLAAPDARAARPERAPFDSGGWVALSVGRNQRAEARWILPLLCRAGDISKDDIGAIRVQPNQTLVEISARALDGFLAAVGPAMKLEDDIALRRAEGPNARPAPAARPRPASRPVPVPAPVPETAPAPLPRRSPEDRKARWTPDGDGPLAKVQEPRRDRPEADRETGGDRAAADRPRAKPSGKPGAKPGGKPYAKAGGKPARPYGKPGDKPAGGAAWPYGKPGGKPARPGGKAFVKPGAKPGGKPAGKPAPRASDTSRRFVPPGKSGARKP
ncbi:ATP-dependent RNA helicase, DEAD/DEAH box family protein [Oceaniovalibus guishaninsula JLT2003]|uniref:ATP-dependent RNA helicase, DEAD/DEAH box family protein n=1 Tax=Oceaniovalibus guishaninsula JLT2003 TaxID=1231392 RepID=K2I648_9RHOB|nr:DEAD/DEAH box helicase [Oceaniovalibus guishaninsula]EKE44460.1 ATP-dependent RNA helicase, DEAD/DEAH box family protein [Oceaniovalibus guishaninsula JLT2003]